jgi:5'-nucleotidase
VRASWRRSKRPADPYAGPTSSDGVIDGPEILDILSRLDDEVDVVVSGHAHGFTNALVKNANGKEILVTQAFSASTAYGDIELEIDRRTGDVASKTAEIVTTWGDAGPGLSPHPVVAAIVAAADEKVAPLVNRVIARAQGTISKSDNAAGESALGNLIADAQRAAVPGAQIALMNPGGIRADLAAQPKRRDWGAPPPTLRNSLVAMDLTGAQVLEVLERQWLNQPSPRILKPSGIRYTWDAAQQPGSRIVQGSVQVGGAALDPTATYRVVVNSFLAEGGDDFTTFASGANRVGAGSTSTRSSRIRHCATVHRGNRAAHHRSTDAEDLEQTTTRRTRSQPHRRPGRQGGLSLHAGGDRGEEGRGLRRPRRQPRRTE